MNSERSFFNFYNHGFVRVSVAVPEVRVAHPAFHAQQVIALMQQADQASSSLVVFPELCLSSYTCDDLFHQLPLLQGCIDALQRILDATHRLNIIAVVGMPLHIEDGLFNCAVVVHRGHILGVVPKTYIPNYREFYEGRQFASGDAAVHERVDLCGQSNIPFGSRLLFRSKNNPLFSFHVEICEDVWVPIPPSSFAALAGATVLLNLSASNITIGKAEYRHQLVSNQSARCLAGYLYTAAGVGESTTDLAWDGHAMIYENGRCLAESERFSHQVQLLHTEIDVERLSLERMRQNSFGHSKQRFASEMRAFRVISFEQSIEASAALSLSRVYERFPYVPSNEETRHRRCYEAYQIQVQGLTKRLKASGIRKAVIGISGGLDSTHALIVTAKAFDLLGYPRTDILAYTMPAFATSDRTLEQARMLMQSVGCSAVELDIRPSCEQMLEDLGHPYSQGQPVYDITFENVQAGERTNHLFRLANHHGGLVVGTGDLSELALGWCTYGVGDHMSHYNVNASVPKTLIQFLIRWVAETEQMGTSVSQVLMDILNTEISPELIPGDAEETQPAQRTEDVIGPYELQDFHLFYTLRYGFSPSKTAFLAHHAWHDKELGDWPNVPEEQRNTYTLDEIKKHLRTFLFRFFQISQFKRTCIPNAPKVGSGGSLSPRGDYRAPSDGEAAIWLKQLEDIPDSSA